MSGALNHQQPLAPWRLKAAVPPPPPVGVRGKEQPTIIDERTVRELRQQEPMGSQWLVLLKDGTPWTPPWNWWPRIGVVHICKAKVVGGFKGIKSNTDEVATLNVDMTALGVNYIMPLRRSALRRGEVCLQTGATTFFNSEHCLLLLGTILQKKNEEVEVSIIRDVEEDGWSPRLRLSRVVVSPQPGYSTTMSCHALREEEEHYTQESTRVLTAMKWEKYLQEAKKAFDSQEKLIDCVEADTTFSEAAETARGSGEAEVQQSFQQKLSSDVLLHESLSGCEEFYGLPSGSATFEAVESTSAGLRGWGSYARSIFLPTAGVSSIGSLRARASGASLHKNEDEIACESDGLSEPVLHREDSDSPLQKAETTFEPEDIPYEQPAEVLDAALAEPTVQIPGCYASYSLEQGDDADEVLQASSAMDGDLKTSESMDSLWRRFRLLLPSPARGSLAYYDASKGSGFIIPDDGGPDLLFKYDALTRRSIRKLAAADERGCEGKRLRYTIKVCPLTEKLVGGNVSFLRLKNSKRESVSNSELQESLSGYEEFHRLPPGSATRWAVQGSSAGLGGWVEYAREGVCKGPSKRARRA